MTGKTLNNLATKQDLEDLRDEIGVKLQEFRSEVKNDILTFKDEILFELKALREEFTAHTGSHQRIEEEIEELKKQPLSYGAISLQTIPTSILSSVSIILSHLRRN